MIDSAIPDGIDAASVAPAPRQRNAGYTNQLTTAVTLPSDVRAGSALVAIALSQEQPAMTIADNLNQGWQVAGVAISPTTGSKVNVWFACNAKAGAQTVSVTQSFNNGPVHVAIHEISDAAPTACIDQQGQNVVATTPVDQSVTSSGALTSNDEVVVAGFGAWFDAVTYVADLGDSLTATVRPSGTAPMGDTLATVVSVRQSGVQTIHVRGDHGTQYAAYLVSVR